MTHNTDNFDFQELRGWYKLLEDTLEKQGDVNYAQIKEAIDSKLEGINRGYKYRPYLNLIVIPLSVLFYFLDFGWLYICTLNFVALLGFFIKRKAYKMLEFEKWCTLNMAEARERIVNYRKWSRKLDMILYIPAVALGVWTIFLAGDSLWDGWTTVIVITIAGLLGIVFGEKEEYKELNEALKEVAEVVGDEVVVSEVEEKGNEPVRYSWIVRFLVYLFSFGIFVALLFLLPIPKNVASGMIAIALGYPVASLIFNLLDRIDRHRKK